MHGQAKGKTLKDKIFSEDRTYRIGVKLENWPLRMLKKKKRISVHFPM